MAPAPYVLTGFTLLAGIVAFALNFACMVNTHWGDFTSSQLRRAGYLNPWRVCPPTGNGDRIQCESSQSLSRKLFMAGVMGNTGLFFQILFVCVGLVEIVLVTQRRTLSSQYRACLLAKTMFSAGASLVTTASAYLFTGGRDALVTYSQEHSPPVYVWWSVVLLSVGCYWVSCLQTWSAFRHRMGAPTTGPRPATPEMEEIPLQEVTTSCARENTVKTAVETAAEAAAVATVMAATEPQPSTSRSGICHAPQRAGPYRSALVASRIRGRQVTLPRTPRCHQLTRHFQAIQEEFPSYSSSDSD